MVVPPSSKKKRNKKRPVNVHSTAIAADVYISDKRSGPNRDLALYPINLREKSVSKSDFHMHRYEQLFRHTTYAGIVLTTLMIAIAVMANIARNK